MTTLGQARTYGGVGSILALLLPVPSIGWLLSIAGLVLMLFAVKYISEIVKDPSIFNDMIISVVLTVVGIIVGFFVLVASLFRFMGLNNMNFADFGSSFNQSTIPTGDWIGLVTWALAGVAVVWILLMVSSVFLRRSYSKIGKVLNVGMFGTAGLIFLVGAATTILAVGFILIPVAFILMALAFFSIGENSQGTPQPGPVAA